MSELNNIENYNDRLIYLTNEVNKVTYNKDDKSSFKNINYTYIIMISLPIIIAIILIILKPDFVKTKTKDNKGKDIVKKISYLRIIIIIGILYGIEFLIKFFLIDKNVSKPKTVP